MKDLPSILLKYLNNNNHINLLVGPLQNSQKIDNLKINILKQKKY